MDAALPRLNVQAIPNGPAMPDGWIAPDPVGDLMGTVEDPFADSTVLPGGVDPDAGQPYDPNGPANQPRPRDVPPDPRPEPQPRPEREASPLFF